MQLVFTTFQPSLGSFEAALAAAAAGATHRKKENAPPPKKVCTLDFSYVAQIQVFLEQVKEEYSDDDDIPWAERMAREKNGKSSEKKKDKKRKASSDSEDEYKPEVSCGSDEEDDIPWSERIKRESLSPSANKKPKVEVDSEYEEVNLKKEKKRRKKDYSDSDDDYAKPKNEKGSDEEDDIPWSERIKRESLSPSANKKPKVEVDSDYEEVNLKKEKKRRKKDYSDSDDDYAKPKNEKVVVLSDEAEEVAAFYARMLDHEYTTKDSFNKNFFHDWRKVMTPQERELITDLKKCDFRQMDVYFKEQSEIRKAMTKEEKQKIKEAKEAEAKIYGVAIIDGHKQKVGNFRIEPPGLFRGRGGHPKMGMLKKRIHPEDVIINCSKSLALRAGNEKDVDEAADTVGCCSLRCEHIKLYEKLDDKEYVVEFDFLGKDSIRYFNQVPVEKRVFKNLQLFMDNKEPGDDLFDRLDTASLNEHLRSLMDGLTVKVFRTYNASITLQQQLAKLTRAEDNVHQKMLSYNRANRMVAILCNHQRAVPKGHEKAMGNLEQKIKDKKQELKEAKAELEKARGAAKEKAQKKVDRLKEQLKKLKIARTDRVDFFKDENKQIALSTSKLNYLDPRISVAWCKKFDVPIEKVFNKTLREKFRWAIDMTMSSDEEYIF
ncbi:Eukaryotic DNA topoisomerase I, catalytic core [Ancylostoma duodenale]|uniref:DNA topoisomerase n=1 Tax=Ancylostoma duodenale TaxID=51022 RepID=A0A0C2DJM5_9BILA|nr:Eukaryotic DNA topoisomerase I, catalytic core [Ancylostoma duodenale]